MYKAIAVLGEGMWQIDVILGEYEDEKYAERIAKTDSSGFVFVMKGEVPAIMARVAGVVTFFDDKDVIITEISKEKQALMGKPLDISVEGNKQKALDALINKDPAYMITEKDMVSSEKTLLEFIAEYGLGYKPDHLAYYVEKV